MHISSQWLACISIRILFIIKFMCIVVWLGGCLTVWPRASVMSRRQKLNCSFQSSQFSVARSKSDNRWIGELCAVCVCVSLCVCVVIFEWKSNKQNGEICGIPYTVPRNWVSSNGIRFGKKWRKGERSRSPKSNPQTLMSFSFLSSPVYFCLFDRQR